MGDFNNVIVVLTPLVVLTLKFLPRSHLSILRLFTEAGGGWGGADPLLFMDLRNLVTEAQQGRPIN